jgi:hypothetical protein
MRLASVLFLALALPACASVSAGDGSAKSDDWHGGSASERKEYGREGGYVGFALVQGMENFDAGGRGVGYDDSNVGVAFRGGWRRQDGFAAEASIEDVRGYGIHAGPSRDEVDLASFSVTGKYYFTDGRLQPYALAGLGYAWLDSRFSGADENGAFVRIGGGGEFYITSNFAAFGEMNYNRMLGDVKDFDHLDILIGVLYRF